MDEVLKVQLLGRPAVFLNNQRISFPYRQAEAIFYYLLEKKSVNKEALADLIWEEKFSEEKIHANLRNAFYVLRKLFGKDFLLKQSFNVVSLNPEYPILLDTEQFRCSNASIQDYKGDFLDSFYLKNNHSFQEWISATRQDYKVLYIKRVKEYIFREFQFCHYEECESLCKQQITINEFDETAYLILMKVYREKGDLTQALQVYEQLERLLDEELFEIPGEEIRKLAADIERERNKKSASMLHENEQFCTPSPQKTSFYGRSTELQILKQAFRQLNASKVSRHILISGEAGIGKSSLMEYVLEEESTAAEYLLLDTQCYFAEEKYILKPWQKPVRKLLHHLEESGCYTQNSSLIQSIWQLFPFTREHYQFSLDADDISTYDYKSIQSLFINACIHFSRKKKLVFYFDDIQWADRVSLSLLRDFITSLSTYPSQHILFLFTVRDNCSHDARDFINILLSQNYLSELVLKPFTYDETVEMAQTLLPDYSYTDAVRQQLFQITDGNALFITETVHNLKYNKNPNALTTNMLNIIRQRIVPIPEECRKILDLISLFFDGISYQCLSVISRKEDFELVEILEYLLNQHLLKESLDQNNTFFSFTHQKILDYVYNEMSWTKKRFLHNKIGLYYESLLKNTTQDMALYPKLIYHFERGANWERYLKFSIKYLYNYLNVTHEFFPVIENNLTLFNLEMQAETKDSLSYDLNAIEKLLSSVEQHLSLSSGVLASQTDPSEESLEILSDYLHMIGRHYIRICNYEKGLAYIQRLKELNTPPTSILQRDKLIQANRQLICVYINRYEPEKMESVIQDSLALLSESNLPDEIAIWKRLRGLCYIMKGDLEHGISDLEEAIHIFSTSSEKDKHLYNLAACYSWIGEAHRHTKDYQTALFYYEKAISICRRNFLVSGTAIFYAYAGMAAFDSQNYPLAEQYLSTSILCYTKSNLMWGRSLSYSYMGLLQWKNGDSRQAFSTLDKALEYASKLESRYELGVLYRVRAQIAKNPFPDCEKARSCLDGVYSPIDLEYLQKLSAS